MTNEEIEKVCRNIGIYNYSINNGLVNVDGDVELELLGLREIPVRFGDVGGNFHCNQNKLTSLEGCPKSVLGTFDCSINQLSSLEGCPETIGGDFYCYSNWLTDLVGGAVEVGADFMCSHNELTSLKGCPKIVGKYFDCKRNKLTNIDYIPESLGGKFKCLDNPIGSIFNDVGLDFLEVFKTYRVIKGDVVNIKRLSYVMSLFNKPILAIGKVHLNYKVVTK